MRVRPFFWILIFCVCGGLLVFAALLPTETPAPVMMQAHRSPDGSPAKTGSCATGAVHTLASTFKESCVDVAKGGELQIIPAVPSFHILDAGSWVNGKQVPMNEPDASTVNNVQVTMSPVSIGSFNVAGTFHIYCPVHPNMDLTIVVQ